MCWKATNGLFVDSLQGVLVPPSPPPPLQSPRCDGKEFTISHTEQQQRGAKGVNEKVVLLDGVNHGSQN